MANKTEVSQQVKTGTIAETTSRTILFVALCSFCVGALAVFGMIGLANFFGNYSLLEHRTLTSNNTNTSRVLNCGERDGCICLNSADSCQTIQYSRTNYFGCGKEESCCCK